MGAWLRWERKNYFRILQQIFSFGGWLRRPGGQGGFRPPPYAPLDPLYPLQTAEGYPRTPPVPPRARPLVSRPTGAVSRTPFGLAWGQQPIGCRGGHAPCMALVPGHVLRQGGSAVAAPCLHSKDKPAPRSRGRDQLRQAAFSPKANTRVAKRLGFHEVKANLEGDSGPPRDGREPSWARPCEASGALFLSNGGAGGGHAACTLWPPKVGFRLAKAKSLCDLRIRLWRIRSLWRPLGTFPRGESTSSARRRTKPPTRNRFLAEGNGKELTFFFLFRRGFRLCGGDQRAFRSPFGNLRCAHSCLLVLTESF